jgi:hypothetical protein
MCVTWPVNVFQLIAARRDGQEPYDVGWINADIVAMAMSCSWLVIGSGPIYLTKMRNYLIVDQAWRQCFQFFMVDRSRDIEIGSLFRRDKQAMGSAKLF